VGHADQQRIPLQLLIIVGQARSLRRPRRPPASQIRLQARAGFFGSHFLERNWGQRGHNSTVSAFLVNVRQPDPAPGSDAVRQGCDSLLSKKLCDPITVVGDGECLSLVTAIFNEA
jgi:hypothetical protein